MPKAADSVAKCAYCTGNVDRTFGPKCTACKAFHHRDCWIEFEGCTTFGCKNSPDMMNFQSDENR